MRLALPPLRRSRIPLTSLVDVVCILLFFFMLASQRLDWRALKVSLSPSVTPSSETVTSLTGVTVVMLADGKLYLRGKLVERAALLAHVSSASAGEVLRIVPGRGLSMQQLVDMVDLLKPSGISIQLVNARSGP